MVLPRVLGLAKVCGSKSTDSRGLLDYKGDLLCKYLKIGDKIRCTNSYWKVVSYDSNLDLFIARMDDYMAYLVSFNNKLYKAGIYEFLDFEFLHKRYTHVIKNRLKLKNKLNQIILPELLNIIIDYV